MVWGPGECIYICGGCTDEKVLVLFVTIKLRGSGGSPPEKST